MALTLETAKIAGQLATELEQVNNIIAMLQAAVTNGEAMMSMQCQMAVSGQVMQGTLPFSVADTATIFNTLISVMQANANAITAQLASM